MNTDITTDALAVLREIVSQCDQGGEDGKVFARDNCIARARVILTAADAAIAASPSGRPALSGLFSFPLTAGRNGEVRDAGGATVIRVASIYPSTFYEVRPAVVAEALNRAAKAGGTI